MVEATELKTERLRLRQWKQDDLPPFAEMSADPGVMKYFLSTLTREESEVWARRCQTLISERGWGLWALESKNSGKFLGVVGLHAVDPKFPFAPGVEVGWRLAREEWGKGYASEAARAALDFAFGTLGLDEVCSFTTVSNRRSQAVMKRLGMVDTGRNFDHFKVPAGHPLREHVLYRISKNRWDGDHERAVASDGGVF